MSASPAALSPVPASPSRPRRSLTRVYLLEIRYEWRKQRRLPAYVLPTLLFPLMFYLFFGVVMKHAAGGFDISRYLLATYGTLGVMTACLFGFGTNVAAERGQGWMLLKRATPMPPFAHLLAKLAVATLFGVLVVIPLFAVGATLGGVRMPPATWLELGAVIIAGSLPFAAVGLAIGSWAGPNSAASVVNLVALPMAIVSGLWVPISMLPHALRQVARGLPAYHAAQLALGVIGQGDGQPPAWSAAVLVFTTVLALGLAWAGYRRDSGKTWG